MTLDRGKVRLGAHMSISGGAHKAIERGHSIGCETIQMFTRNPSMWRVKALTVEDIAAFAAARAETDIHPVVAHSSYLINLGSPEESLWQRSLDTLVIELERCAALGIGDYVLHPGAHKGEGEKAGMARVSSALTKAFERTGSSAVRILLETTAGQGSSLGCRFEQLAWMIEHVPGSDRLGVCFDTAHVLASGYEFRDRASYDSLWNSFDGIIGIDKLHAIHLNDSKRDVDSHVDRHEQIGEGFVGLEPFRFLVNDSRLVHIPMILETPKDPDLHQDVRNLRVLRGLIQPSGTIDMNAGGTS